MYSDDNQYVQDDDGYWYVWDNVQDAYISYSDTDEHLQELFYIEDEVDQYLANRNDDYMQNLVTLRKCREYMNKFRSSDYEPSKNKGQKERAKEHPERGPGRARGPEYRLGQKQSKAMARRRIRRQRPARGQHVAKARKKSPACGWWPRSAAAPAWRDDQIVTFSEGAWMCNKLTYIWRNPFLRSWAGSDLTML